MYIERSEELAKKLMVGFDSTPTGIPYPNINLKSGRTSGPSWASGHSILSEIGTTQLEFYMLSKVTNNSIYAEKPLHIFDILDNLSKGDTGLYPIFVSPKTGRWTNDKKVTLGALGDSFYEYLLKLWLLTGKKIPQYRRMYDEAIDKVVQHMIVKTKPSDFMFLAELKSIDFPVKQIKRMDHLVCFAGGMFALGQASAIHIDPKKKEEHLNIAKNITKLCKSMYSRQPTGIAPEIVSYHDHTDFSIPSRSRHYLLRPGNYEIRSWKREKVTSDFAFELQKR
eukprot:TRINITY_DN2997_c0_g1_i2.p1 TRINITY_DN2997_c0_g1~~TRINITY_DN2997_c0_g1_i2.p1  ORF type:complete len:294 (+),score=44.71 TRINITY_DN2997_c0_g1_i2:42-884(+)